MGGKTSSNVSLGGIPAGVERTMVLAAQEPAFRDQLLEDRAAALSRSGLRPRDTELALLLAIPPRQLRSAIEAVDVSMANLKRRSFLQTVAASTAALAVGIAAGCDEDGPPSDTSDTFREDGVLPMDQTPPDQPLPPDQEPPDVQNPWPDWPRWPDMGTRPNDYGGAPFGCQTDADCFGEKCCETPWGVKLCSPDCNGK